MPRKEALKGQGSVLIFRLSSGCEEEEGSNSTCSAMSGSLRGIPAWGHLLTQVLL